MQDNGGTTPTGWMRASVGVATMRSSWWFDQTPADALR